MTKFSFSLVNRRSFTPKLALDFASLIEKQAKPVYEKMGIVIPVITSSTLVFIRENKTATLLDVANGLGISHQLASQRVKALLKLEVILASKDEDDKRKTNYQLSKFGETQSQLLDEYLTHADEVFLALYNELGFDLMAVLTKVNRSFVDNSLLDRIFPEG